MPCRRYAGPKTNSRTAARPAAISRPEDRCSCCCSTPRPMSMSRIFATADSINRRTSSGEWSGRASRSPFLLSSTALNTAACSDGSCSSR